MSSRGEPDYLGDDEDEDEGQRGTVASRGTSERLEYRRSPVEPGEKERFYSRLATIPNVRTMPSIGDWILLQVERPSDLARKVNRRLAPGMMTVPRGIRGAVRIHVGDPKENEELLKTLRDLVA